jgi:hypothetical protein
LCFIRLHFADANSDKGENLEEVAYTMVCPSPDLYKDLHSDMVIPKLTTVAIYSILCFIRLHFADANSDKGENLEEVAYTMVCPSPDLYKDLHSDMVIPKLTTKLLEDYLQPMGKKLGNTDKNMYSEKYLSFVRICNKGRKTYIHAECHAEMKKSVACKLDIILESDGVISECQCECTVGSGPSAHCKHVCACLYGLCLFGDGKPILTQESCTQKLQTFHVAKKHTGTPVKAHNLPLSHVNERIRYDPRPPSLDVKKEALTGSEIYASTTLVRFRPLFRCYNFVRQQTCLGFVTIMTIFSLLRKTISCIVTTSYLFLTLISQQ